MEINDKLEKLKKLQLLNAKLKSNIFELEQNNQNNIRNNSNTNNYNNYLNNNNQNNNKQNNNNQNNIENNIINENIKQKILKVSNFENKILDELKDINLDRIKEIQKDKEDNSFLDDTLYMCNNQIKLLHNEENLDNQILNSNNNKIKNYLKLSQNLENLKLYSQNNNVENNQNSHNNNNNNDLNNINNSSNEKNKNKADRKYNKYDDITINNLKLINKSLHDLDNNQLFIDNNNNSKKLNMNYQSKNFKESNDEEVEINEEMEEIIENFIEDCYQKNGQIVDIYMQLAEENNIDIPDEDKIDKIKEKLDGYIFIPPNEVNNLSIYNYIKYFHVKDNIISVKRGTIAKNEKNIICTVNFNFYWSVNKKTPIFKKISSNDIKQIVKSYQK